MTEKTRNVFISGLSKYLGIKIIRSNQNAPPPSYPYGSFTITMPKRENKGTYGIYDDGFARKPYLQTISLSFLSDDYNEAVELAEKAYLWADYTGTTYLNDNGVIVQLVTSVNDRSNFLTVEYEQRLGFDVILYYLSETNTLIDQTGTIETAEIQHIEEK